jgi:membrane-bound metal-dependent hydrolase YbcI (DUF457 family)
MLIFGTIGIPIGITYVIARLFKIQDKISYLFIGIGAILPDLIDKPLGVILYDNISNGRLFMHTFLIFFILFTRGLVIFERKKDVRMLCLSGGVFWHLISDEMWLEPVILLWPLYGHFLFDFPLIEHSETYSWIIAMLMQLKNPFELISEIIGFIIVMLFLVRYFGERKVHDTRTCTST